LNNRGEIIDLIQSLALEIAPNIPNFQLLTDSNTCQLSIVADGIEDFFKDALRFVVNSLFLCINFNRKLVNSWQIKGHP
jgi:hypothetical protein